MQPINFITRVWIFTLFFCENYSISWFTNSAEVSLWKMNRNLLPKIPSAKGTLPFASLWCFDRSRSIQNVRWIFPGSSIPKTRCRKLSRPLEVCHYRRPLAVGISWAIRSCSVTKEEIKVIYCKIQFPYYKQERRIVHLA